MSFAAVATELQHVQHVNITAQLAILDAGRTCEDLRQQAREVEKQFKNEEGTIERSETFMLQQWVDANGTDSDSNGEEMTKPNAQLGESTLVNRDNVAEMKQFAKALALQKKKSW
ncbi:hypothetical protein PsorP6_004391 [Peronosclerospora sorghi]|uniref:Uncharacterized protein n=1 Tax=Peronosclerospora sorghi TaxID=230839 RepID=A0ACC0VNV6_9STRA|nr:hypothetical protein PsorP6_004391 [Peronosclerospora sorghi]